MISNAQVMQVDRFYTGWYSHRNPLIVPMKMMGRMVIQLYDAIKDGLNMELSNRMTLVRRPGWSPVNSNPVNGTPLGFYTFKPTNFPGQLYNLVDTTEDIEWLQSNSSQPPQVLLQKQTKTQANFAQVAAYLYIAGDNILQKWDGPAGAQGVTRWGIDITAPETSTGWKSPSSSANWHLPTNPSAPSWTDPNSIVGATPLSKSTSRVIVEGAGPRAGQIDLLNWLGLPNFGPTSRYLNHITGTMYEALVLDTDPHYPTNYPTQTGWFIKNVAGNPWDVFTYDQNYAIKHWITENGDAPDQAYCKSQGYATCWTYPRGYKRFLNPLPIMPRFFTPGSTVTIDTPAPNRLNRTVNCEQSISAVIDLGPVRGVTTGPINLGWGGSLDTKPRPGNAGPAAGPTPTIKNEYYYTQNKSSPAGYSSRETTYYVENMGRVAWYSHTWNGSTWVFNQTNVLTTFTPPGSPVPNFPCGPGKTWFVPKPVAPLVGFSLIASTATVTLLQGTSVPVDITVNYAAGFSGAVTLAVTGLSTGLTASFDQNPTTGTAVMTLHAAANANIATGIVTITGTASGSQNATISVGTSVGAAIPPSFTLSLSNASLTLNTGTGGTINVQVNAFGSFAGSVTLQASNLPSGVTASFNPNPTASSAILQILAAASAPTSTATVTITGTSSNLSSAIDMSLGINAPAPPPPPPPPDPTPVEPLPPPDPPPPPPTPHGAYVELPRQSNSTWQGPQSSSSWLGLWQHNQNAAVADGNFATRNLIGCELSPAFIAGGFGFNLPANAEVLGIQANVQATTTFVLNPAEGSTYNLIDVHLCKAGAPVGENLSTGNLYTGAIVNQYGSPSTLWGTTWTPADINNSGFGLHLQFLNETSTEMTIGIDFVSITVFYVVPIESGTLVSQPLLVRGFGLSVPANVAGVGKIYVTGIQVLIQGVETQGDGIGLNVALTPSTSNGSIRGEIKHVTLPSNVATITLGDTNDQWGGTWIPDDVNAVDWGVWIQAVNQSSITAQFNIAAVQVNVFYVGGPVIGNASGGTLSAETGYQYVYAYGNSNSGHISSPTYPSISTGNFTNREVGVVITASPDPQVNEIHVYRTTDGGGQPFFELPNSPFQNASGTIADEAPDNELQINSIAPLPHFNDPPPPGLTDPVWFAGRLWGHVRNSLYFASGPDITVGNEQEAWFPAYVYALPSQIIRKFPTPNGMLVCTEDNTYIVRGTSTATFTVNDFLQDVGIKNYNAGVTDGTNIYLYTSDRQLLLINANGIQSISGQVADEIQAIDPALAHLELYRYTAMENFLFVSDGSTFIYPYNVDLQAWGTPAAPIGGVGAIGTLETSLGVFEFWRGRPVDDQIISRRDLTTHRDDGTPYPCYSIFGPIPVAQFLNLAQLRDIVMTTGITDSRFLVSVLSNEISTIGDKQFQMLSIQSSEPPMLEASQSFRANRYSWMSSSLPELMNFVFLRLDWAAADNADELFSWTLGGTQAAGSGGQQPAESSQQMMR